MTDEHQLIRDAEKASKAQQLLDNPLLKEAFEGLELDYTNALLSSHIDDANGREKLFLAVNVVRKVRDHLSSAVSNGKLATAELRELAQVAERQKTWPEIR